MASSRFSRLFLVAVALFISFSAILATLRFGVRAPSILHYLRPARNPFQSQSQRPLMNSSMAPAAYKKPPQLPPRFTATPDSLVADTKALVCPRPPPRPLLVCLFPVVNGTPCEGRRAGR